MGIDPGVRQYSASASSGSPAQSAWSRSTAGWSRPPADPPIEQRLGADPPGARGADRVARAEAMAIEDLYFGKNVRSAIAVGQARGVAMLAAAERGIPCFDYTPQAVKLAVCGSGAAAKDRSSRWSAPCSACREPPDPDHAADALAVAICHAGARRTAGGRGRASRRVGERSPDDRRGQRRGARPAPRPRRHRRRRRRLPAGRLRGDAEGGARRPASGPPCTPT